LALAAFGEVLETYQIEEMQVSAKTKKQKTLLNCGSVK